MVTDTGALALLVVTHYALHLHRCPLQPPCHGKVAEHHPFDAEADAQALRKAMKFAAATQRRWSQTHAGRGHRREGWATYARSGTG